MRQHTHSHSREYKIDLEDIYRNGKRGNRDKSGIYFLSYDKDQLLPHVDNIFKVGCATSDVRKRVAELKSESPIKIVQLSSARCFYPQGIEHRIHYLLRSYRYSGEWFRLDKCQVENICALFDILDTQYTCYDYKPGGLEHCDRDYLSVCDSIIDAFDLKPCSSHIDNSYRAASDFALYHSMLNLHSRHRMLLKIEYPDVD